MELWLFLVTIVCLCTSLFSLLFSFFFQSKNLPPGPPTIPILGNFLWLIKSSKNFSTIEPIIRNLRARYGPIVTLRIGSRPSIFITTHDAAYRALVLSGSAFASRPPALETTKIFFSNQHTLSTAPYGSLWRLLRQNFMTVIHPNRLHLFSDGRKWALEILKEKLTKSSNDNSIVVVGCFQYAFFCLLVYICFGEKYEEEVIREIERAQKASLTNFIRFNLLNFMPKIGKIFLRKMWTEVLKIRNDQENVLLPLITKEKQEKGKKNIVSYIHSLLDLRIPDSEREFSDSELVSLCSEFINGGTDTSTTTLQWVMANIVKQKEVQKKLFEEINDVVSENEEIKEEDIKKMPYLKAVVLETLRRHPPGHFILPRAVTEEVNFDGYTIPKDAMVNFTVAEMGWDGKIWENPMEFKPERFINNNDKNGFYFDIKGVREIKMMPFGAGRRVCPAIGMALLHIEYFVANLVREFEWRSDGEIDLTENQEFTMVMKYPLRVSVIPRRNLD